ncbi:uncharacterized protein si:ch211-106h4.12 isoform X2 [Labeo rohita]|uniref:uncharacterized protein si:ch211-106h4.12 isoform X2 n=1 Tax=Labeo rohita TaxID=84645 RepID=UPI0021E251CD|nr:uncharacterized protein si:ch211-106h4.12 isoform X2 [Labeo rohita]
MKSTVQIGLLCLSLLISSLCGEEVDGSMETPLSFDEPDLEQFEMYRVRQQAVSTKENTAKTVAAVPSSGNSKIKRKWPRPGHLTPLGDSGNPMVYVHHRTKRQEKSKNKKRKNRPGSQSLLAKIPPPQQTVKVKREAGGQRPLPES